MRQAAGAARPTRRRAICFALLRRRRLGGFLLLSGASLYASFLAGSQAFSPMTILSSVDCWSWRGWCWQRRPSTTAKLDAVASPPQANKLGFLVQFSLAKKVAVVTGSSRGLGRGAALGLAEAGADVALLGRDEQRLAAVKREVAALGQRALVVPTDVTKPAEVDTACKRVLDYFGRVDVLVNNAGVAQVAPLFEIKDEALVAIFNANVFGTFYCCRAFGAHMVAAKRGSVILMASISGMAGEKNLTAYSATKGAVIGFTHALASEWAPSGVRVNAIAPGYFRTDLNRQAIDDATIGPKIVRRIPLRRVGQPEEIGPLVVYLASDASAFMTGQVVVLDGGQLAT